MVSLTLSIPEDLKREMDKFPEINWSEIARASIKKRIEILHKFREFTKDSEFTEEDALKFGKMIKKGRFKELYKNGSIKSDS